MPTSPRWRWPATSMRCASTAAWFRPTGRSACRTTRRPTPRPSCSWCAQGNPKGIKDWDDLAKPGVQVITPNPKTSGGARWNYLAAWEFAKRKYGGDAKAKEFVAQALRQRAGARHRRARLHHHLRAARPGRRAASPGRTRPTCWRRNSADKFDVVVPVDQHPGRAAGDRGRQDRRQEGHARRGRGIPQVPVHRGRPGHRRQATSTARPFRQGQGQVREAVPEAEPVHHRPGLRRLGQGRQGALRRRRLLRPDLQRHK